MEPEEIYDLLAQEIEARATCQCLIQLAPDEGGEDNIAVIGRVF